MCETDEGDELPAVLDFALGVEEGADGDAVKEGGEEADGVEEESGGGDAFGDEAGG